MAYIGKVPSAVPITSADLADSIVTSAKIADGTIALADLSATGIASASTYLRGDNSWGAVSSDYVLISHTATTTDSVSEVSFDNVFTSTYDIYEVYINHYRTNTDGGSIRWRWRRSGSTITDVDYYGNFGYHDGYSGGSATGVNNQWGLAYIQLGNGSATANYYSSMKINVFKPLSSRPLITFDGLAWDSTSVARRFQGGSFFMSGYGDGFNLVSHNGSNLKDTGDITIYGKKKA